jgi:glycine dehydrogenase subunit 2
VGKVHAFYGNFGILVRAYSYIRSMGADLKTASQLAVLNANYIKETPQGCLSPALRPALHARVRLFRRASAGAHHVATLDIAKRLMEYGFHPPTVYFPLVVRAPS